MKIKKFFLCANLAVSFFGITKSCLASENGPYIGAQLGYTYIPQGEFIGNYFDRLVHKVFHNASLAGCHIFFSNSALGGRVFAGYQFNRYFAAELGYYRFRMVDVKGNAELNFIFNISKKYTYTLPINVDTHVTVKTEVLDLVAKGILPITENLSLYGKLGAAYIFAQGNVNLSGKVTIWKMSLNSSVHANPSISLVYPEAGFGANYDINKHLSTDFSWIHIQKYNSHSFPSIDLVSVGLLYHF